MLKQVRSWQIVAIAIFLVLTVLSVVFFSEHLSSPEFHWETIQTLDDQKLEAMAMTVTVTAASTALSVLQDDIATPIANELADLASPLFLIVCIIYLEKFLVTTCCWFSFSFLIPGACLLASIYVVYPKEKIFKWVKKLLILAIGLSLIIPCSAKVTSLIEETYSDTVKYTLAQAKQLSEETQQTDQEGKNVFVEFFTKLAGNVTALVEKAKMMLSVMVDAVAVLLITSCIIPILTALLFVWLINKAMNIDLPASKISLMVVTLNKRRRTLTNQLKGKATEVADKE